MKVLVCDDQTVFADALGDLFAADGIDVVAVTLASSAISVPSSAAAFLMAVRKHAA